MIAPAESGRSGRGRCGSVDGGGGGGGGGGHCRLTAVGSSVSKDSCFLRIPRRFASGLAVVAAFHDVVPESFFGVGGESEAEVVVVLRMLLIAGDRPAVAAAGAAVLVSSGSEVSFAIHRHEYSNSSIFNMSSSIFIINDIFARHAQSRQPTA